MDQYVGRILDNRYELLELIGKGGMANVYKAMDHRLNRQVAVKILKSDLADSAEFRRRFHYESLAVAQLSHVNIVSVYDVSQSGDLDYIVMELIDGITLKQYMERRGNMDWREALHFIIQIMRGLSHAHSRGIIHRDIKPQNIMVLRDGSVKVADFGIACLANAGQTLTQEALGSVHYISPEQARGDRTDARSDIYSAGVVLYEMLTGRLPFEGDSAVSVAIQHLSSVPLAPRDLNPEVPEALEMITMKAMCPDLERRYGSADEMLDDLEHFRKDPNIDVAYIGPGEAEAEEASEPTNPLPATKSVLRESRRKKREESGFLGVLLQDWKKIALVVAAFGVALFLIYGLFQIISDGFSKDPSNTQNTEKTEYYEVPNLIGKTLEEAEKLESVKGIFIIRQNGGRYDPNFQPGQIIDQDPEAGKTRASNGDMTIHVYICVEENKEIMPDLVGDNYQEARARLNNLNLSLTVQVVDEYDDEVEKNDVIRTVPTAGTELKKGDTVVITYSKGPEKLPVTVPSFLDMKIDDAIKKAESLKLVGAIYAYEYSDKPDGVVIGQSIEANTEAKEGDTIRFTVSRGRRTITVVDYSGLSIEEASARAKEAGLVVGSSYYINSSEPEGTVLAQDLSPKTQVTEGTEIVFTVSKGPETFTVTYADGHGGTIGTFTVSAGEKTPTVADPTWEGHVFIGWSPTVSDTVTGNVTYTAQWEEAPGGGDAGGGN